MRSMTRFLGDRLREVRLELRLTQAQAARELEIDVRTYRRYESGEVNDPERGFDRRRASRARIVQRIVDRFGIDAAELFAGEEEADAEPPTPVGGPRGPWLPLVALRHFVGRDVELAAIDAWHAGEGRVLALVAIGGAGKSSLLTRWLATREPDAYVWSCYEDARVEALLAGTGGDLDAVLAGDGLLVLDGLERLQSDGRPEAGDDGLRARGELLDPTMRQLVRAVVRGRGPRLLVTSRFGLADLAAWEGDGLTTLALEPLGEAPARELLRRWGVPDDETTLARLTADGAGHALSLAMLGSLLARHPGQLPPTAPLAAGARDDPLASRLGRTLDAYTRAMSALERDLLTRLSTFAGTVDGATLDALRGGGEAVVGAIAGAEPPAIDDALNRLDALGLLERTAAGVRTHPFVRDHFRALLDPEAARAVATLLERPGEAPLRDLDRLEALLELAREAGRVEPAFLLYQRAMGGLNELALRRGEMLRGERVLRRFTTDGDPEQVHPALAADLQRLLVYDWGYYAAACGDLHLARACLRSYLGRLGDGQHPRTLSEHATGLRTLAYLERLAGQLESARELIERSIALARSAELPGHLLRGLALLARIELDEGALPPALLALGEASETGPLPPRSALLQAEVLAAADALPEALTVAFAALAESERRGWPGHAAHAQLLIARLCLPDDPTRARAALEASAPWRARSGEADLVYAAAALEAQLDPARAAAILTPLIPRARDGGFIPHAEALAELIS